MASLASTDAVLANPLPVSPGATGQSEFSTVTDGGVDGGVDDDGVGVGGAVGDGHVGGDLGVGDAVEGRVGGDPGGCRGHRDAVDGDGVAVLQGVGEGVGLAVTGAGDGQVVGERVGAVTVRDRRDRASLSKVVTGSGEHSVSLRDSPLVVTVAEFDTPVPVSPPPRVQSAASIVSPAAAATVTVAV